MHGLVVDIKWAGLNISDTLMIWDFDKQQSVEFKNKKKEKQVSDSFMDEVRG